MRATTFAIVTAVAAGLSAGAGPAAAEDPALWGGAIGWYDLFQDEGFQTVNLNVEWRGENLVWTLRPLAGIGANLDGAIYGYGGIALDLKLGDHFVVTPTFAPTLYFEGHSKDLGSWMEFRSGIEVGYRFDDHSRIAVAMHHLSNASTGSSNPGTEILSLYYLRPLSYPFGQ